MSGIIDNPERALLKREARLYVSLHPLQHRAVRPPRIRHEMMQRLMLGSHVERIGLRRQRLHALTLERQHQTAAIISQALVSSRVIQCFA